MAVKKLTKKEETKLKLEREKEKLLKMLEKYEKPVDFGSDVDHFDEEADETEELSNQLGISEAIRERINEIDATLSNLNKNFNLSKKDSTKRRKAQRVQKTKAKRRKN